MKAEINNQETGKAEFFTRIMYSFQVLMIGIALPFLFLVGISDGNQKKPAETEVKEISMPTQLSASPIIGSYLPGI